MITPWPVPPSKREKVSCLTISTNLCRSLTVRKLKITVTNCRFPIDLDRSPAISRIYRNLAHPRNEKRESNSSRAKHPLTISSQMIHQTTTLPNLRSRRKHSVDLCCHADQAWKGRLPLPGPRFLTAASFATPQAEGHRIKHPSSHRSPCRSDFRCRPPCIVPTSQIGESGRCQVRNRSEQRAR